MKWIKTNPSVTGWFWYKDSMTDNPMILRVVSSGDRTLYASDEEISFEFKPGSRADKNTFWSCSPIPEPI